MAIANFPTALVPIIQTGYLTKKFEQALRSHLAYRTCAERRSFPGRVGQTITDTRAGLKAPVDHYINPTLNTNLDNSLNPAAWAVEQFSLTIGMVGDTIDLNTVTERVGIADQFVQNAYVNGVQASQTLERFARDALYGAYMGGSTAVRTTLGSPGQTVAVNDVRGFQSNWVNGTNTATSNSNYVTTTIGSNAYNIGSVAVDGSNVSTTPGGISGTLTTVSGNISTADGTAGNAVGASNGTTILRPNARAGTGNLVAGDILTMGTLLDAVTLLRRNAVPTIDGAYNLFCDPVSSRELFADNDFRQLFQGATSANGVYRSGVVADMLGIRFMPTNEVALQASGNLTVHRPILVGKDALIEGDFADMNPSEVPTDNAVVENVDGVVMVTRMPLDRLSQIIAQSWYWVGGFAVPSDTTTNTSIIPTSTNAAYKRAVIIEHV